MIEGSHENLKCKNSGEEQFSKLDAKRDLAIVAWTVRWVLSVRLPQNFKKSPTLKTKLSVKTKIQTSSAKTFIVYRSQMLHLLSVPKPPFDQLAIELPCLMGFRASEVATWKAGYIDYPNMNTEVLDSKKKKLFTIPLNLYVAEHAEIVLEGRLEGNVLRSRSTRNLGQQLTPTTIWYIWDKWTKEAGLPNAKDISPTTGRRFFAAEWYYHQKLSLVTLQMILRHSHFETTVRYVQGLVFYEDLKRDYDRFQFKMMDELQKQKVIA